jgi:uncharacterized protein YutE (UPF0331/DUF86 family)
MAGAFDDLRDLHIVPEALANRLKGAVGFRNVAIHAYRDIDWRIVHTITHERLDDFRQFARHVLDALDDTKI